MKINNRAWPFLFLAAVLSFAACQEEESKVPKLIFRYKLDSTQQRLDNIGQPAGLPAGHAGQHPEFYGISSHYLELAPNAFTQLGKGAVLYHQAETQAGGDNAIDHSQALVRKDGEVFFEIPFSEIPAGSYEWIRLSLAYQNYAIRYRVDTVIQGFPFHEHLSGRVASFVGFNTYIRDLQVATQKIPVNSNKKQGFWAFESQILGQAQVSQGQAGGTTVPNPLAASSPIPAGSCVVTGSFEGGPVVISGKEQEDRVVTISLSINRSFEWKDIYPNGVWEPLRGESVVDMGIRGLQAKVE